MKPWRFYVYELLRGGECVYIGKSCGDRLKVSTRERCVDEGREIARFKREKDAYAFERQCISQRPELNIAPGGNGAKASRQWHGKYKLECEIEAAGGTKPYAARVLLAINQIAPHLIDQSKVETFRQVAYGARP